VSGMDIDTLLCARFRRALVPGVQHRRREQPTVTVTRVRTRSWALPRSPDPPVQAILAQPVPKRFVVVGVIFLAATWIEPERVHPPHAAQAFP
jgi:hypothetical protein